MCPRLARPHKTVIVSQVVVREANGKAVEGPPTADRSHAASGNFPEEHDLRAPVLLTDQKRI
jgi:hypothetical protein